LRNLNGVNSSMDNFLPQKDELSRLIQSKAAELHNRMSSLDIDQLGIPEHCLWYLRVSHLGRLFFSIQTSAHLLYRSISLAKKPVNELALMDYGAGVGTLYILAKMIGCKTVVYNDHLHDWKLSAERIAVAVGVNIDHYVVGDIGYTLQVMKEKNIVCDIILSRNVVEHIYKLDDFFGRVYTSQPQALLVQSTTANFYNPAAHLQHVLIHRRWEKVYRKQRAEIIRQKFPGIDANALTKLARATRGLAMIDLDTAIAEFKISGKIPDPSVFYTNTCAPDSGVWAEHLITFPEYKRMAGKSRYDCSFEPGFWDTHYRAGWKNLLGKILNAFIGISGKAGILVASFIYVVAKPPK
jgi:2-polyprenyl-3-methyl-5-hydroxy-6-metoxy-1,4-benzoquinol methylase